MQNAPFVDATGQPGDPAPLLSAGRVTAQRDEFVKRAFDIMVAFFGLLLLSPLLLLLGALVVLDSPGPPLYRARRAGRHGVPFRMCKLRTMVKGAAAAGPGVTGRDDPRVTRIGRWLRRTKLDELPQLWNVLVGEMSLVGPRPEAPEYAARYPAEYRRILQLRPGITGPAALAFRHEEQQLPQGRTEEVYLTSILPLKLAMDLDYMERRSFAGDPRLLLGTLRALR